ncbi:MAG TPA: ClpXP protease specificity-enhancing factor [Rhizomicrobium sp.]|nr:ClpXP protease specificity-enhancing factor [Rhizomicrobium sp.]
MSEPSTKPYLIRAIHQWCTDAGFTPYVAVAVGTGVRVPTEHVKNGEIVLNVSALATSRLLISNDAIEFQARFAGVAREIYVPIDAVIAIYARENGQGMAFEVTRAEPPEEAAKPTSPAATGPATVPSLRLAPDPRLTPAESPAPPPGTEPDPGSTPTPPSPDRPRLTRIK